MFYFVLFGDHSILGLFLFVFHLSDWNSITHIDFGLNDRNILSKFEQMESEIGF